MAKTAAKKESTSDFENLVSNGIDFLEKAMSQLNSDPKHSVINFYTAVELFLKAPLVHESWTLVLADHNFNRQQYETGDFQSVSFDDACTRLGTALKKQLKPSAKEAFDKVRKHRNRMVHFYHAGINGTQREEIKLEQAQAWFELNRFVVDTWRDKFQPFLNELRRMERNLIAHNHYAQAKFESLLPKIAGMTQGGKNFRACPRCGMAACQVEEEAERVSSLDCLVCFYSEKSVQVDCPSCDDPDQAIALDEDFTCTKCQHVVSGESEIFALLDQSKVRGTKHDIDSNTPANCDECQGYHTICEFEGGYLCANCFSHFDTLGQCEYCGDNMSGNTEDTYAAGCEHCDGAAGRYADD